MNRSLAILLGVFLTIPLTAAETQRYLVSTRSGAPAPRVRVASNAELAAARQVRTFPIANAFAANLTADEVAELRADPDTIVEPIVERSIDAAPAVIGREVSANVEFDGDPQITPWGVQMIRAAEVWPATRGANVNVVVMDTGIDSEHADLRRAYAGGYNVFDPAKPPKDGHRHGTHVAGTIAATDDAYGVVGVAPDVKLWAVKVLEDTGKGTNESVVAGFEWVMQKAEELGGRWVVNLSLGSTVPSEIEERAVSDALSREISVVASAGNRAIDVLKYPARYSGVIAVGAIGPDSKRASFSSFGAGLTLMAPGVDIPSTIIKGINDSSSIIVGGNSMRAWKLTGSPYATVTARVIDCGIGRPEDFPATVRDRIALIQRSPGMTFREKVRNAREAGAAGVIIATYSDDVAPSGEWRLFPTEPDPYWDTYPFPPTIGTMYTTGQLLAQSTSDVTMIFRTAAYGEMNGTSMAAPHVTATVALMLALDPTLNVAHIDYVLRNTTRDIYGAGWDYDTGWGAIDALAAAKHVAPQKFGVPAPQPIPSPRRRAAR